MATVRIALERRARWPGSHTSHFVWDGPTWWLDDGWYHCPSGTSGTVVQLIKSEVQLPACQTRLTNAPSRRRWQPTTPPCWLSWWQRWPLSWALPPEQAWEIIKAASVIFTLCASEGDSRTDGDTCFEIHQKHYPLKSKISVKKTVFPWLFWLSSSC